MSNEQKFIEVRGSKGPEQIPMLDLSLIYSQQQNQGGEDSSTTNNDGDPPEQNADNGEDDTGKDLPTDLEPEVKLDKI